MQINNALFLACVFGVFVVTVPEMKAKDYKVLLMFKKNILQMKHCFKRNA